MPKNAPKNKILKIKETVILLVRKILIFIFHAHINCTQIKITQFI